MIYQPYEFEEQIDFSNTNDFPLEKNTIYIFTDGGISGNGMGDTSIGAHAYILFLNGRTFSHAEAQRNSTSNREELLAILHSLQKLKRKDLPVVVTSDSQYCVNGLNTWLKTWKKNKWKTSSKEDVKNKDLWIELDEVVSEFENIKFFWVRGHSGHLFNERCDTMCAKEIVKFKEIVSSEDKNGN